MRVSCLTLLLDAGQVKDAVEQIENQCIQTVEFTLNPRVDGKVSLTVTPHFGDVLDWQMVELLQGG